MPQARRRGVAAGDVRAISWRGHPSTTLRVVPLPLQGRIGRNGFTLIEIMVALAVFSLAVLALVRLESATIRGAGILDETLTAQIVARNVAVEAMTDARPPVAGLVTGREVNGGRNWAWTRTVQPVGDGNVMRIDVSVAGPRGGVLGRATMIRAPRLS